MINQMKSYVKRNIIGIEEVYVEIYKRRNNNPIEVYYMEHKMNESIFDFPEFSELYQNYMNGSLMHIKTISPKHNQIIIKFIKK